MHCLLLSLTLLAGWLLFIGVLLLFTSAYSHKSTRTCIHTYHICICIQKSYANMCVRVCVWQMWNGKCRKCCLSNENSGNSGMIFAKTITTTFHRSKVWLILTRNATKTTQLLLHNMAYNSIIWTIPIFIN